MSRKYKLKDILKKYDIRPKKKLGQNFISDCNVLDKIANNILPVTNLEVIEIGPGPGGLSVSILKNKPSKLIMIEKDSIFKEHLKDLRAGYPETEIILEIADVLKTDLDSFIKNKTKIISNLPYYVSSEILVRLLPLNINIIEMVLTFQTELAERIIALPNQKDYSRLSVIVQSVCNVIKQHNLSAKVFFPEPNVESSVLKFIPKKKILIQDFEALKFLTKLAFNKRRKKIKNSLKNIENISYYLSVLKIDENCRPENISVEKYCKLSNLINKKIN